MKKAKKRRTVKGREEEEKGMEVMRLSGKREVKGKKIMESGERR